MTSRLLLLLTLFCACRAAAAQGYDERLAAADVLHYTFFLDLNDTTDVIRGTAGVRVRFRRPLSEWTLDLIARGADRRGMTVVNVRDGEEPATFRHSGEALTIALRRPAAAGEERTFRIDYEGIPADGLIISRNKFGDRTFFGDNWPNRAHHWIPCVDHPADKASVEFVVSAPEHYQVVSNGSQQEETNLSGARKLTHWHESVPLPTKVMVIGAAPFAVQYLGEVENVPLSSWIFPKDRTAGFHDYAQARTILAWFIRNVGPYPFAKLANVQSKTRYGGMENAGAIFYSEHSVTGNRDNESLIAHEIAHQWFGNSASEADWRHVWLSEGFATYFANLYFEQQYGRERLTERLREERQDVLRYARGRGAPIVDTTVADLNQLLNPNSYQKGGWVLHMLRRQVGDEAFRTGIRTYYERFRTGNALTADLQRVMEEVSGQDLGAFFRQWVFTPGFPDLEISPRYDAQTRTLHLDLRQTQPGPPFAFPLDVDVAGDGLTQRLTLEVDAARQSFALPLAFPPRHYALDPDTWLLFRGEVRK